MPTYVYRCEKCGNFEVKQRITENALTECITCQQPVERLITATSFALKGGGWYASGYGSSGSASSESSASTSSATSPSTATTSTTSTTTTGGGHSCGSGCSH